MEFGEDYFERGIETGVSLYTNYRWMPEATIRLAMAFIDKLCIGRQSKILDFGCAKGYLVKAFRLLWRDAWGCDISPYAISNCDSDVKDYVKLYDGLGIPFDIHFDLCIAKDVFEHVVDIERTLSELRGRCSHMFAVIPLGNGLKYNVPAYDLDKTHIIAQTEIWWEDVFKSCGWTVREFSYRKEGIKDNWSQHKNGNGFFELI